MATAYCIPALCWSPFVTPHTWWLWGDSTVTLTFQVRQLSCKEARDLLHGHTALKQSLLLLTMAFQSSMSLPGILLCTYTCVHVCVHVCMHVCVAGNQTQVLALAGLTCYWWASCPSFSSPFLVSTMCCCLCCLSTAAAVCLSTAAAGNMAL